MAKRDRWDLGGYQRSRFALEFNFPPPSPFYAGHAGYPFDKAFPDSWWMTGVEIRILEFLGRFKMSAHVKNIFSQMFCPYRHMYPEK